MVISDWITAIVLVAILGGRDVDARWIAKEDRFYFISSVAYKWIGARSNCEADGGKLVTINDEKEMKFLLRKTEPKDGSKYQQQAYWIGLSGMCEEYSCTFNWDGIGDSGIINETHNMWAPNYPVHPPDDSTHVTSYVYIGNLTSALTRLNHAMTSSVYF